MSEVLEKDFTRNWTLEQIQKIEDEDIRKTLSKIYTQEETRIREKGIETMLYHHLIKEWIPEYKYKGCDKDYIVHDFKSAMIFTFKMYKSVRNAVDNDKRYYGVIGESINRSIKNAKRKFKRRKNALIKLNKLFGHSTNELKQAIIDKKVDFVNLDLNAINYTIKLYNNIYNTK